MKRELRLSIESTFMTNNLAMTPDEDGRFKVIVGATNVYNSSGAFYKHDETVANLFSAESEMLKRVSNGIMKGEQNHPSPMGMSNADFIRRIYNIDESNTAFTIESLSLSKSPVNLGRQGTCVYPVYATIKPSGPKGDMLYESLISPDSDTAFSVRSITIDSMENGTRVKQFKYIVNYDWVHAPGIAIAKASQWKEFGLESDTSVNILITAEDIASLEEELVNSSLGLESKNEIESIMRLFKTCNDDTCIYNQWS